MEKSNSRVFSFLIFGAVIALTSVSHAGFPLLGKNKKAKTPVVSQPSPQQILAAVLATPHAPMAIETLEEPVPQLIKFPPAPIPSQIFSTVTMTNITIQKNATAQIRVGLFPILPYAAKTFARYEPSRHNSDPYHATKNLTSIHFTATKGLIHLARNNDKGKTVVAEGRDLEINLERHAFMLDGKTHEFEDLFLAETDDDLVHFEWDRNQGYDYHGSFIVTKDATPRGVRCLRVVNVVDIETYDKDVVPAEMSQRYPIEALKVQAVASRTYGVWKMAEARCMADKATKECTRTTMNPYDVAANTADQLYLGTEKETDRTNKVVLDTANKVVVQNQSGMVFQNHYLARSTRLGTLSQIGAIHIAQQAEQSQHSNPNLYEKILRKYYPNTQVVNLSEVQMPMTPGELAEFSEAL